MRYQEILEFVAAGAANLPTRYPVDDETGLALNLPNQWTQSPYLGAVKSSKSKGYVAQIHVPQAIWSTMVQQNPGKWTNAPATFFNEVGNQRPPMRVAGFADPRQAAWFVQEVLYGGNWAPQDIIEDYFEELYLGGDGAVWKHIKAEVPAFEGEPLGAEDEKSYFADPEAFNKRREAANKQRTQASNSANYPAEMSRKIKKALVDFYSKNAKSTQKRFGQKINSPAELDAAIDSVISDKGIDYFITAPGSVKLKDIASLPLK